MSQADDFQAALYASQTLITAVRDGEQAALDQLISIEDRYGSQFTIPIMLGWIDILLTGMRELGYAAPGAGEPMTWSCVEHGHVMTADQVDPDLRWAGWMITARAHGDLDQATALINLIDGDQQYTEYLTAVLHVCSWSIQSMAKVSDDDAS